jgi:hypothetical protein
MDRHRVLAIFVASVLAGSIDQYVDASESFMRARTFWTASSSARCCRRLALAMRSGLYAAVLKKLAGAHAALSSEPQWQAEAQKWPGGWPGVEEQLRQTQVNLEWQLKQIQKGGNR